MDCLELMWQLEAIYLFSVNIYCRPLRLYHFIPEVSIKQMVCMDNVTYIGEAALTWLCINCFLLLIFLKLMPQLLNNEE